MDDKDANKDANQESQPVPTQDAIEETDANDPVRYPTNHVLGVLDTEELALAAVAALQAKGFRDSEVSVQAGEARADAVNASTGRSGLPGLAIRIAEKLGIENFEMEMKERYEQALRDGLFVILVATPTEDRKDLAAEILAAQGAHTVAFHGRFTIEGFVPPAAPE